MLGHHWPASETLNGVSLAVRRWPANSGIWVLLSPHQKKTLSKLDPSDKTVWIRTCRELGFAIDVNWDSSFEYPRHTFGLEKKKLFWLRTLN